MFLVRNGGNGCNSWSFRFFPNAPATLLHSPTAFPALCALPSKFHGVVPLTGVYRSVRVFVRIWSGFRARKRSPNTVKPPLRCKFDFFVRVGALKFTQNAVYAPTQGFDQVSRCGSAPTQTHPNHWFWCKNEVGVGAELAGGQNESLRLHHIFFSMQGTCMNFNRANL